MATGHGAEDDPSGIRRAAPVDFLLTTQRIEREARVARDAAIGAAVIRTLAAFMRGVRLLSSVVHEAFVLRDMLMPARQRSRTPHPNHYQ